MIHKRGKLKGQKKPGKQGKTDLLTEYKKLYKLAGKWEAKAEPLWTAGYELQVVSFNRVIKKMKSIATRAAELESILRIPKERRWTNAYR